MILDSLIHRLLRERTDELLSAFAKSKNMLSAMAYVGSREIDPSNAAYWTLEALVGYFEEHKTFPSKASGLAQFVKNAKDEYFELVARHSIIKEYLKGSAAEYAEGDPHAYYSDPNVLCKAVIEETNIAIHTLALDRSKVIGANSPDSSGKQKSGIAAANAEYKRIMEMVINDRGDSKIFTLQESQDAIYEALTTPPAKLINLGCSVIDKAMELIPSKFMVVAGSTGEGKSLFLNSRLYAAAKHGHRVLLNSVEFSEAETLAHLAYIHTREMGRDSPKISYSDWMFALKKDKLTATNKKWLRDSLDKLAHDLPGRIDVVRETDLERAKALAMAGDYDVVAFDPLYLCTMEALPREQPRDLTNRMYRETIKWTHAQKNFFFITPAQVSRTENRATKRKETVGAYDANAVSYGEVLTQDADFLLTVFSDQDLKAECKMIICVPKARGMHNREIPPYPLQVDQQSMYVFDELDNKVKAEADWASLIDKLEPSDVGIVLPKTPTVETQINMDEVM